MYREAVLASLACKLESAHHCICHIVVCTVAWAVAYAARRSVARDAAAAL